MSDFASILLEDLFTAYFEARKNKRNTKSQLAFEMDVETNIICLYQELIDRTYQPGSSICFVVYQPVQREIFASEFRDRVVHHLLHRYIAHIFDDRFIYDSYSCRKGKGTFKGIERIDHHIRSCSDNYKKEAYVLKLDLKGYFMSIDKKILHRIIEKTLDSYWASHPVDSQNPSVCPEFISYLVRVILDKDPTEDVRVRGSWSNWDGLPHSKCLSYSPKGIGLPIGDLTSQLFSNIYLDIFDQYVKRDLKIKHYGRYVDDFFIIHRSKSYLKALIPIMADFLDKNLSLVLHPQKVYLQSYKKGVLFLGGFVKPYRWHPSERSIRQFHSALSIISKICRRESLPFREVDQLRAILNSYCGYLSWFKSYRVVKKYVRKISLSGYFYFKNSFGIASICYKKGQGSRNDGEGNRQWIIWIIGFGFWSKGWLNCW